MSDVTYKKLIKFYLPLIISAFLKVITHAVINNALGKLHNPDLYISSYNTSFGLILVFQQIGMCMAIIFTTFTVNENTYKKVRKYSFVSLLMLSFLLIGVAYSPLSRLIFTNLYNLKGDLLEKTVISTRFICFFSIFVCIRTYFEGIAIKLRYTFLISAAAFMRLALIFAMNIAMPLLMRKINIDYIPGLLLMMCGIIEMMVMVSGVLFYAKNIGRSIARACAKSPDYNKKENVSNRQIFMFALPLILSGMLSMLLPNVTNSALALSYNAEKVIAAYSITMILNNFVCAMSTNLQLIIINHNSLEKESEKKIRTFVIIIGAVGAVCLAFASFTAFGDFVLMDILNVLYDTTLISKIALAFVILNPLFITYATYYYGYLIKIRRTKMLVFQRFIPSIFPYILYLLIPIVPWQYAAGLGAAAVTVSNLAVGFYNHLVFKFSYKKYTLFMSNDNSSLQR